MRFIYRSFIYGVVGLAHGVRPGSERPLPQIDQLRLERIKAMRSEGRTEHQIRESLTRSGIPSHEQDLLLEAKADPRGVVAIERYQDHVPEYLWSANAVPKPAAPAPTDEELIMEVRRLRESGITDELRMMDNLGDMGASYDQRIAAIQEYKDLYPAKNIKVIRSLRRRGQTDEEIKSSFAKYGFDTDAIEHMIRVSANAKKN